MKDEADDPDQRTRLHLLTVDEVAELLRFTPKGVYCLIESRRIAFVKISNRVRFFYTDVVDFLRNNRVPVLANGDKP